jgi:hypothetical protein
VLLEKGVDVQANEKKLDKRTQRLPRMNKAQEEEFKELESLLASAIATVASEYASVVRECVCTCVRVLRCQRVAAQSPSTVPGVQVARRLAGVEDSSTWASTPAGRCPRSRTAPEQLADARPPADAVRDEGDDNDVTFQPVVSLCVPRGVCETSTMCVRDLHKHCACETRTNSTISTSPPA